MIDLQGQLTKIEGANHIRNLLRRAAENQYTCVFWSKDQSLQMRSVLVDYVDHNKTFSIEITDGVDRKEIVLMMERQKGEKHLLIVLQRGEPVLCLKALYYGVTNEEIRFEVPEFILELQRRKNERYVLPWGYEMFCEFEYGPVGPQKQRLIDVSEGGISFLINQIQFRKYKNGDSIKGLRFRIRQHSFTVDVSIKQITRIEKDPRKQGYRVGCAFDMIDKDDARLLYEFVSEQIALNISQHFGYRTVTPGSKR